jgi:FkbM family methyltransferase
LVKASLHASGRELVQRPATLLEKPKARLAVDLDQLIALLILRKPDLFFVQIGAFDGQTGDQLHPWIARYDWSGILVEPQPRYFAALKHTYADRPKLQLRDVAIAEVPEERTLYTIREGVPGLPHWAPQVASFDRARLQSRGWRGRDGEDVIEAVQVQCLPLPHLLDEVKQVDLLQIDVEGYDAEIIRMFDFDRFRPAIVRFESRHLSRGQLDAAVRRLVSYGYRVAVGYRDTLAWHDEASSANGA